MRSTIDLVFSLLRRHDGARADIAAIKRALKANLPRGCIGKITRRARVFANCCNTEYTPARCEEAFSLYARACVVEKHILRALRAVELNFIPRFILTGIPAACEHHAACAAPTEAHGYFKEPPFLGREHDLE